VKAWGNAPGKSDKFREKRWKCAMNNAISSEYASDKEDCEGPQKLFRAFSACYQYRHLPGALPQAFTFRAFGALE